MVFMFSLDLKACLCAMKAQSEYRNIRTVVSNKTVKIMQPLRNCMIVENRDEQPERKSEFKVHIYTANTVPRSNKGCDLKSWGLVSVNRYAYLAHLTRSKEVKLRKKQPQILSTMSCSPCTPSSLSHYTGFPFNCPHSRLVVVCPIITASDVGCHKSTSQCSLWK